MLNFDKIVISEKTAVEVEENINVHMIRSSNSFRDPHHNSH